MQCAKKFSVPLVKTCWKNVCIDSLKIRPWSTQSLRKIHSSCASSEFHEFDKRSGYDTGREIADTPIERIRLGIKQLKKEIQLWKKEFKEVIECDPIFEYRAGIIWIYCFVNILAYLVFIIQYVLLSF